MKAVGVLAIRNANYFGMETAVGVKEIPREDYALVSGQTDTQSAEYVGWGSDGMYT